MSAPFCGACGAELTAGSGPAGALQAHPHCQVRLELEPPRFCASCGRRMVVQVTPGGWWASCSRHGEVRAGR